MVSDRQIARQYTCECSDPGCKAHEKTSECKRKGFDILYRVDMYDETGTVLCADCSDDAFSSGLFTTHESED